MHINVTELDSIDDIPNSYVYWINNIQQFAIRINGILFRGNIGNIFNISSNTEQYNGVEKCCRKNNCKSLLTKQGCKFYHDPLDLLEGPQKISEYPAQTVRNWSNSSWLYTPDFIKHNNMHMRHIGNRNTLKTDLFILKNSIKYDDLIDKYKSQTMHDILVMLSIIF
jgi:hypothetical protein